MATNGAITVIPSRKVTTLPIDRQIARRIEQDVAAYYVSREEAHAIADATTTPRDRLLVLTLWHTGGRISEVISIRRSDYHRDYLTMPNLKQRKPSIKVVFIAPDFALDFLTFCDEQDLRGSDHVFVSRRDGSPLSRIAAWKIVTAAAKRAGVTRLKHAQDRGAWCHLFRHGHAVHLMRTGTPPKIVQEQLGHASILTTQQYLRFTAADKRHFIEQADL